MAVFTMTQTMVDGFNVLYGKNPSLRTARIQRGSPEDQPVDNPRVGDAISHHQIVQLWEKLFRLHRNWDVTLESFMKGSEQIFIKPVPAPDPTPEYQALMKRLRHEADQREYERLVGHRNTPGQSHPFVKSSGKIKGVKDDGGSVAKYQKSLEVGGSFLFSILGVPFAIFAIARLFSHASLETSLVLAAITVPLTAALELFLYLRHEERMASVSLRKKVGETGTSSSSMRGKVGVVELEKRVRLDDAAQLTTIIPAMSDGDDRVRRRHVPDCAGSTE